MCYQVSTTVHAGINVLQGLGDSSRRNECVTSPQWLNENRRLSVSKRKYNVTSAVNYSKCWILPSGVNFQMIRRRRKNTRYFIILDGDNSRRRKCVSRLQWLFGKLTLVCILNGSTRITSLPHTTISKFKFCQVVSIFKWIDNGKNTPPPPPPPIFYVFIILDGDSSKDKIR